MVLGIVCFIDGLIDFFFFVFVVWFKGGFRSVFIRSIVYLEKFVYFNFFVRKFRKFNFIVLLFNILYIININFV